MDVDPPPPAPPSSNPPDPVPPAPPSTVNSSAPSRVRLYPDGSTLPVAVYLRPKAGPKSKSLSILQISKDLTSHYKAVTEISKIRPNKLRVVVNDLKEANDIACSELFTREYRVYVPARDVEIDGVVTDSSLSVECILKSAKGCFKNSTCPDAKVLDCKQLQKFTLRQTRFELRSPGQRYQATSRSTGFVSLCDYMCLAS